MGCGSSTAANAKAGDELTILLMGLDNSGKTTLSYSLKKDFDKVTVPTVGFSQPTRITHAGKKLKIYDVGGGPRIRGLWKQYVHEVHGAVFMVDSADPGRFEEAAAELAQVASHAMLVGKPLLILGNKKDLPASATEDSLSTGLGVSSLTLSSHHVAKVTAQGSLLANTLDAAIGDGFDWLVRVIDGDYANLQARIAVQTAEFQAADAARAAALKAERTANLAARAAADAEGAAEGAAAAAKDAAGSAADAAAAAGQGGSPAGGGDAAPAPVPKPKKAGPVCFVPGCGQPAVRRAHSAKWQAVCDACGDLVGQMEVVDLAARLAAGETSEQVRDSMAGAEESGTASADAGADAVEAAADAAVEAGAQVASGAGEAAAAVEKPSVSLPGDTGGKGEGDEEDVVTVLSPGKAATSAHDVGGSGRLLQEVSVDDEMAGSATDMLPTGGLPAGTAAPTVPGAIASPTKGDR